VSYTLLLRSQGDGTGGSGSFTALQVPVPAPRDGARRPLTVSVPLSRARPRRRPPVGGGRVPVGRRRAPALAPSSGPHRLPPLPSRPPDCRGVNPKIIG
jgi:hypothetical protein